MNEGPQLGSRPFALSAQERTLWGVRYSGDVLRLRSTGPRQAGAVGLVIACAAFAVAAALGTEEPIVNVFFWTFHSRVAAVGLCAGAMFAVVSAWFRGSLLRAVR